MTTKKTSDSKAVVASGAGVGPTVPGSTGTGMTIVSTGATAVSRTGFEEALQQMLQGFQTYLPAGMTLQSISGGFGQATVVAQLEAILALYPPVLTAREAVTQAVATQRAAVPGAQALMKALKAALIGFYGPGNPALAKFGIVQKSRAKPSSLQSAVAAVKAQQTRQTNGTLAAQSAFVPSGTATAAPQPASPAVPAKPMTPGQ